MMGMNILYLIGLGVILAISANCIIQATSHFARSLHIRSFLLGFFLLGFATTVPEMFVAFQAVADGIPQMSVGNLLGGSILLLSFVMGISAIFLKRIVLDHGMTEQSIALSTILIALPGVVLWDGSLSRLEGFILFSSYVLYVLIVNREQHISTNVEKQVKKIKKPLHAAALLIGGLIGLAISSRLIVQLGENVAREFSVSTFVIGLFLITLGTNLPELILAIEAVIKKKRDIAFGDVLGSAVINTAILGIVCMIAPFSVPDVMRMRVTLFLLVSVAAFFWWAASSKRDITRGEGIVLLIIYLLFIGFEMMKI